MTTSTKVVAGIAVAAVLAAAGLGGWALSTRARGSGRALAGAGTRGGASGPAAGTPGSASHGGATTTSPTGTGGGVVVDSTGVHANWVTAENARQGTTAWRIAGQPPGTIAGFANRVSAHAGDPVTLYVSTDASSFQVDAYRMGYYGGAGARLVWTSKTVAGVTQPACPVDAGTNMVHCDNWSPSLTFTVTPAFLQGDYLLKLVGAEGQQSYVTLTVWDPSSHAAYLIKNDVYTWQAWNSYGGYDFYAGLGSCAPTYPPCNRARVVSFDRPYLPGNGSADFLYNEYPLVRLAEQEGLDVAYATDLDVEEHPQMVLQHRVLLSLGHDECWSYHERLAAQAAEKQGVNMVFFGASPVLRHVRMQPSPLGPGREEVDYRDSGADPLDGHGNPLEVTGNTWSSPPANWSEVPFVGEGYSGYVLPGGQAVPLVVADGSAWIYKGTGLSTGSQVPGLLISDFDQVVGGDHPSNLQILAHSPMPKGEIETQSPAPYSDMTYYTDPVSHAGVFDTGTVAWIPDIPAHPEVQKMTINLLALFGRGPAGDVQPSVPNWQRWYS